MAPGACAPEGPRGLFFFPFLGPAAHILGPAARRAIYFLFFYRFSPPRPPRNVAFFAIGKKFGGWRRFSARAGPPGHLFLSLLPGGPRWAARPSGPGSPRGLLFFISILLMLLILVFFLIPWPPGPARRRARGASYFPFPFSHFS